MGPAAQPMGRLPRCRGAQLAAARFDSQVSHAGQRRQSTGQHSCRDRATFSTRPVPLASCCIGGRARVARERATLEPEHGCQQV